MNRREQERTDPRLVDVKLPCAYCKHAINIGNPYGYSERSTCEAFPAGIPYAIQRRYDMHDHVLPTQEGSAVYESRQVYDMHDGRNYVTWEGKWFSQ